MGIQERRECSRKNGEIPFKFRKIDADNLGIPDADGVLVDYSIAGIRFVTSEQLEKNTNLLIELELDGLDNESENWRMLWEAGSEARLQIIGSVMWCQKSGQRGGEYEVGTRFLRKVSESLSPGTQHAA